MEKETKLVKMSENQIENSEQKRSEPKKDEIYLEGTTFVLSDVHLRKGDRRKKIFLEFIEEHRRKGNIIFLGDIFDVWIGFNQEMQKNFMDFIRLIERSRNKIIYVEGNHDFHLTWLDELGVKRMTEGEVNINGKRFLLSHGDIYSGELSHKIYRISLLKTERIFKMIADGYFEKSINRIGQIIASISRRKYMNPKNSGMRSKIFLSMLSNAIQIAASKNLDGIIFGHCHIPTLMRKENIIYINSGFWSENHGTYVEIKDGDVINIKRW